MKEFFELTKDIWDFLKVRKKYWLAPLIITIVLMGTLIIFTEGSVFAPLSTQFFKYMNKRIIGINAIVLLAMLLRLK